MNSAWYVTVFVFVFKYFGKNTRIKLYAYVINDLMQIIIMPFFGFVNISSIRCLTLTMTENIKK